jgi:hypothetical protein
MNRGDVAISRNTNKIASADEVSLAMTEWSITNGLNKADGFQYGVVRDIIEPRGDKNNWTSITFTGVNRCVFSGSFMFWL